VLVVLVVGMLVGTTALAYDDYSTSRSSGNCANCHGNFRTSPYTSLADGQSWGDDLHDTHRYTMLDGDCDVCHSSGGRFPTLLGESAGGVGMQPLGCSGCHGRAEDGTGVGTEGFGAGLRQKHWRAGQTGCVSCHADSNPANMTPVGENVLPTYYAEPGTVNPNIPSDPCSPPPDLVENFAGSSIGLDNDGNGVYDENDPACSATSGTPGEAGAQGSWLTVTAYDDASGNVSVAYGAACNAADHTIEYGPLADVSTYGYSGQACGLGNTGTATFTLPAGSYFFVVVANDGNVEGSYGTDGAAVERPEDTVSTACPVPQDLSARCD
jgi:hypothetical protein